MKPQLKEEEAFVSSDKPATTHFGQVSENVWIGLSDDALILQRVVRRNQSEFRLACKL
jgi:hypothetical protein